MSFLDAVDDHVLAGLGRRQIEADAGMIAGDEIFVGPEFRDRHTARWRRIAGRRIDAELPLPEGRGRAPAAERHDLLMPGLGCGRLGHAPGTAFIGKLGPDPLERAEQAVIGGEGVDRLSIELGGAERKVVIAGLVHPEGREAYPAPAHHREEVPRIILGIARLGTNSMLSGRP